jgi:hypothetical protein
LHKAHRNGEKLEWQMRGETKTILKTWIWKKKFEILVHIRNLTQHFLLRFEGFAFFFFWCLCSHLSNIKTDTVMELHLQKSQVFTSLLFQHDCPNQTIS